MLSCWSMLYCCFSKASFQLWEIWSRTSDEQGSSLIIRPDGWRLELGKGGGRTGWRRRRSIRQEGWWKMEGKWERKSGWERFTGDAMEGERWKELWTEGDMQAATEEDPSNKLPSPPLQRLSTWMPLSALIHTHARLCCTHTHTTTYGQNLTHQTNAYIRPVLASLISQKCTCMHAHKVYLLLRGDKGACHRSDADCCCSNVIATPRCVRQKWL